MMTKWFLLGFLKMIRVVMLKLRILEVKFLLASNKCKKKFLITNQIGPIRRTVSLLK